MPGKSLSERPNDNYNEESAGMRKENLEEVDRLHDSIAPSQGVDTRSCNQTRSSGGRSGRGGSRDGRFQRNQNVQDDTQSLVSMPTPDGTLGSGMSRVNSLSSLPSSRPLDRVTAGSLGNGSIELSALGSNDAASINPAEESWDDAPTPNLLDPGVAVLNDHKAFESTTGSSSFKYADIEVSSIPQSKQRVYLEEFYRSRLGLSDEKIEEHRLSAIIFFFTELAKRGYNYIPKSFSWLGVDDLTWWYAFKDHVSAGMARPTFPFKTPDIEDDKTGPRCPAFGAWRMVSNLKLDDKNLQSMPVLDSSGKPASRFGLTTSYECRILLDSTGNGDFYQAQETDLNGTVREGLSKKTSTSEWPTTNMSGVTTTDPGFFPTDPTTELEGSLGQQDAEWGEDLTKAWSELRQAQLWDGHGYVSNIFAVSIPLPIARLPGMDIFNGLTELELTLEKPGGLEDIRLQSNHLRGPSVEICIQVAKGKENRTNLLEVWLMLVQWATTLWTGSPIPLTAWTRVWFSEAFPPMIAFKNPVIIFLDSKQASENATTYRATELRQWAKHYDDMASIRRTLYDNMCRLDECQAHKIKDMIKKQINTSDKVQSVIQRGRYLHFGITAIDLLLVGGKKLWGDTVANNLARDLGFELTITGSIWPRKKAGEELI